MGAQRLGHVLLVALLAPLVGHQMHHQRPGLVLQRLAGAAPQPGDQPLARAEQERRHQADPGHQRHHAADRDVPFHRQQVARHRREGRDRHPQQHHVGQPVGQQVGRRGRHDDKGDEQDRADRIERRHRRATGQEEQSVEQRPGHQTEGLRQHRIEGRQLQFLPEDRHESGVHRRHRAHPDQRARHLEARHRHGVDPDKTDLAQQHRVDVDVHVAGVEVQEQHPGREQRREHQPDGGVVLDPARARQRLGQEHGEHPGQRRAHDLHRAADLAGQQPDHDDAEDDRMADRVRQHRVAAQDQERPDQRRRRPHRQAGGDDHQPGVVEGGLQHQPGSPPSPAIMRSASASPAGVNTQCPPSPGMCAAAATRPRRARRSSTARVPSR